MTKAKELAELQRPRRRVGAVLAFVFDSCPLCKRADVLRVAAYRRHTARLACRSCGLRFTVKIPQLAQALYDHADAIAGKKGDSARRMAAVLYEAYLAGARREDERSSNA